MILGLFWPPRPARPPALYLYTLCGSPSMRPEGACPAPGRSAPRAAIPRQEAPAEHSAIDNDALLPAVRRGDLDIAITHTPQGRVRIKNEGEVLDGSPLVAWQQSVASDSRFTHLFV